MRFNGIKASAAGFAVAGAAVLGLLPGATGTAFGAACTGDSIIGTGASLQRDAQRAWGAAILSPVAFPAIASGFGYDATYGCPAWRIAADGGTKTIGYHATGSGAGRAAFGAAGAAGVNSRPVSPATVSHYGGADEAPDTTQLANANAGDTSTRSDDAVLNTIPVAASAVAVVVKLPANCEVPASDRDLTAEQIEGAFDQEAGFDRWDELFPFISGTGCNTTAAVNRVVRYDNSGTTFAFKQYLEPVDATPWSEPGVANRDWPTRTPNWYTANLINGAGAQLATLNGTAVGRDNSGGTTTLADGIAYADLSTARAAGFGSTGDTDRTFWVRVERTSDGVTVSPSAYAPGGDAQTGRTGANCDRVTYSNVPRATTDSWYTVQGVPTSEDYPICPLTYALAWTTPRGFNYSYTSGASTTTPFTQNQQTTVKDYLDYILKGGQDVELTGTDYSPLPTSIKTIAQTGVNSLTW